MKNLDEFIEKMKLIKARGYIKTHRTGNTGIGKTLEDLLDIKENNIDIANTTFAELKSARKGSGSMLTLFTKAPQPEKANSILLKKYGYITEKSNGKKILHTTAKATEYNTLRGLKGFKIIITQDKIVLVSSDSEQLGYWDEETLRKVFEKKLKHVIYVQADCKGAGKNEEFWFNEAWLLSGFNFNGFKNNTKDGVICVDIRIGQYQDGSTHDHGTGFRINPDKLSLCFSKRERLI